MERGRRRRRRRMAESSKKQLPPKVAKERQIGVTRRCRGVFKMEEEEEEGLIYTSKCEKVSKTDEVEQPSIYACAFNNQWARDSVL
jgi:hypothetical protein